MARRICLILGMLAFFLGLASQVDLRNERPRLSVELEPGPALIVAGQHPTRPAGEHHLRPGDEIVKIDGRAVADRFYLNFVLDGLKAGDRISLTVTRSQRSVETTAVLVRSLDTSLLVISFFAALIVWALGVLVVYKSQLVREPLLFFGMCWCLSVLMWTYWPENSLGIAGGHWLSALLAGALGPLSVALFVHFSLVYPDGLRLPWLRFALPLFYLVAPVAGVVVTVYLAQARSTLDPAHVARFDFIFQGIVPLYNGIAFGLGLILLFVSYLQSKSAVSRSRLRLLFLGFVFGISPVVFLVEFPKSLGVEPIISEHLAFALVVLAPLALFVNIVRYQLLSVKFVLRRSLTYFLLSAFVVLAYLILVALGDGVARHVWGESETLMRVLVVLLLAAAFAPARQVAQNLVDRLFAVSEEEQRTVLLDYSRELAHTIDIYRLAQSLSELLDKLLPVDKMVIFVAKDDTFTELPAGRLVDAGREAIVLKASALPGLVQSSGSGAFSPPAMPSHLKGTEVIVPLRVEDRLAGLIALGKKRSGGTFDGDDHHLLKALAAQTAVAFDRARAFKVIKDMNVSLEQKIWTRTEQLADANDRLARQYVQLKKLNEMKEALTRMVVHDLKNPVSTILLGLEFLDRSQVEELPESVSGTLNIISSTAMEIQDLISNLLDVYRMEAGEMRLDLKPVMLTDLFEDASRRVAVLAKYRQVEVVCQVDPALEASLDREVFIRVLVNLLTNAVKHSRREKNIELVALRSGQGEQGTLLHVSVTNSGMVIPHEVHERLFEKFFQVEGKKTGLIAGTGLGLAFCKLVVEAHGGQIAVESPPGDREDGARFILSIPLSGESTTESGPDDGGLGTD